MKYVRTAITLVLYLARLVVLARRADVLHIFTPGYSAFLLFAAPALLLGKRTILNYHDGRAKDHLQRSRLARWLLRRATRIVVPSDYLVEVFARFGFRAERIYNIAETSLPFRERRRPRPIFLHNRGLGVEYNPACTLRAFAIVQRRYPEARITFAHNGSMRDQLKALTITLGLRNVEFIGSVPPDRMPELYDSADIYLMSPDADNMPLSVLECFAAGLPVVSTNVGGIPDLIDDQVNGLLFPPNDHEAMAACTLRLLEEPGLASTLAANGRRKLLRYSRAQIVPEWVALYASINSE